jgi:TPR repeat protein
MFGRRKKSNDPPPVDPDALYKAAKSLTVRDGQPEMIRLMGQAADAGHKVAAFDLGVLLEKNHDLASARARYEQARELGHQLAGKFLAALTEKESGIADRQGELDDMRHAAETGDPAAIGRYAWHLRFVEHDPAARDWFERGAAAGDRVSLKWLAENTEGQDVASLARTEGLLRADAEGGDGEALSALAAFLKDQDPDAAVEVFEWAHAAGDGDAAYNLAHLLLRRERPDEAERWFRIAADGEGRYADLAAADLGYLLLESRRHDEAEPFLRRDTGGGLHLAWLLEGRGDDDGAMELYDNLVQDDDQFEAKAGLARIYERRGDADEAAFWREQAEEQGADPQLPPFAVKASDRPSAG